ncbi:MAG TPA: AAA family ATPase, partial [Chloroflexota bacterium]|nr:AAA family ATPase [Chloroflexota bacterium]
MPAPRISVSILGPWELRLEGRMLPRPSTQKAQSLLAYLIVHGNSAHAREKLAALFWPDADEDRAQRSLRTALWSLRRLLDGAHPEIAEGLCASRFDVRWAPRYHVEVDLEQFEQATRRWTQVRDDPEAAVAILQPAVALYRGPLLEGLYDDWCLDERYRLEEQYLTTVQALVTGLEATGQYREAVSYAQRLLVADPLREEVHRIIIRLLGNLGDRAGVMRQHRRCKEVLARELDVAPSPETEAIFAEALQTVQRQRELLQREQRQTAAITSTETQKPAPTRAASGEIQRPEQQATAIAAVSQPPAQQESRAAAPDTRGGLPLVGRDAQWRALIAWLEQTEYGQGHAVLIAGEAGSGKTRLLEEVASRARWRSVRVLWGSCYEYERMLPYQPFTEALRNGLRSTNAPAAGSSQPIAAAGASDADALAALPAIWQQAILLLLPDWGDRLTPSPTSSAAGADLDQTRLLEGIGQLLQALAARQPLLLVIDDLHWAAPSTLQLFHHIARTARRHRILLLGSYRPEDVAAPSNHEQEVGASSNPTLAGLQRNLHRDGILDTVVLKRLQREDVLALVESLPTLSLDPRAEEIDATGSAARAALAERLHQFTEGNPLYLVAAMQSLREGGELGA